MEREKIILLKKDPLENHHTYAVQSKDRFDERVTAYLFDSHYIIFGYQIGTVCPTPSLDELLTPSFFVADEPKLLAICHENEADEKAYLFALKNANELVDGLNRYVKPRIPYFLDDQTSIGKNRKQSKLEEAASEGGSSQ